MRRKILFIMIVIILIFGGAGFISNSNDIYESNNTLNETNTILDELAFVDNSIQVNLDTNQIENEIIINTANEVTNQKSEKIKNESVKTTDTKKVVESKTQENKKVEKEVYSETVQEVSIQKAEDEPKKVEEPTENKEETKKTEETKQESQPEVKPQEKTSQETTIPTEEYRFNEQMTNQIISIINSNPSSFMISDGYNVVVDSSIVNLTNQFTFSEVRVKNAITYKAGTIRVYARDYYYNGQFIFTECYII